MKWKAFPDGNLYAGYEGRIHAELLPHIHSYNQFRTVSLGVSHIPEALELPLFDAQQLTGLSADNGSMARCVVQDGLPERRPNSQCTDSDCILHTNKTYYIQDICLLEPHIGSY